MKALLRGSLAGLMSCFMLSLSATALAEGEPCYNDDDCPGGGAECGGDVCNWNKVHPAPVGDKGFTCNPAGTDPKGQDGWCTTTDDCKCKAQGANCNKAPYCSFTKASDAPAGTAGGGSGAGGSAAGGSAAGGTSASGAATGGSAPTAGTTGTAGTGTTTPAPAADDGGCSVSMPGNTGTGALLALGVAGLGLALARRRR